MSSSSATPDLNGQNPSAPQIDERYRVGTLVYTKASLVMLFGWMIWGNICFNLFESMGGPSILGLYLQDNFHVSNLTVNILFNVIPMALGTVMTPIISFKSDRTRSKLGRRIPYILYTTPFLVIFAAAIGFSDDIIRYAKTAVPETWAISPLMVGILVIGVLTVGFSFFNEFVGTVYYYLLPDVMPRHFIGRFQGISHMAGTGSTILINMYLVPYQLTHMKAIHVGIAILYFVGFGLVCWRVKEGQYPPVTDVTEKTKVSNQVRLYFRECFTHRIFILFYLSTAAMALTRGLNPSGVFGLHLSEHQTKIVAYEEAYNPHAPAASGASGNRGVDPLVMAMTPDGHWVISGSDSGEVKIWDDSGKKPVLVKTFSPPKAAATQVERVQRPLGAKHGVTAVAVTPDGQTAVAGTMDGTIRSYDVTRGKKIEFLQAHPGGVLALAVSPKGQLLASGGADNMVRVWDLGSGKESLALTGHTDKVNAVAFSSDGSQIVSGGQDAKVIIWDIHKGAEVETLEGSPGPVYAVAFAPALGPVPAEDLPPLMTRILKESWRFLQQVFTNESLYDVPANQTSRILARDGWILSGGRDGETDNQNSRVRIWDVATGEEIQSLRGHKEAISTIVYKADLRVILSGSGDGSVRLWKPLRVSPTADDQSYKTFSGYTRGITSMDATVTGSKLVNASTNGTLHVWNMDRGISLAKNGLRGIFFAIIGLVLAYPIGALIDRWNPIKIFIWTALIALPFPLFYYLWFHSYMFGLYMDLIRWPFTMLHGMATLPMMIMLLPKSKYGQFSSANALVRQFVAAIAGPMGAVLMDSLTHNSIETDYFRYGYLFQFIAHGLSLAAMVGVYYYWKKLGGENYVAPEAEVGPATPASLM